MDLPDFNALLALSRDDPQALENLRQKMVASVIEQANPALQPRLRGLQFQIDAQRQIASNPLGACVRLSRMMSASFAELMHQLNHPSDDAGESIEDNQPSAAKVLPFQRRPVDEVL